jgi:DNA-binding CsgD family transcriptional regulator
MIGSNGLPHRAASPNAYAVAEERGAELLEGAASPAAIGHAPLRPLFSPAELRVLCALADHGTTQAAAQALFLSPRTIDHHLERIRDKLGCRTALQCVVLALREGIIE